MYFTETKTTKRHINLFSVEYLLLWSTRQLQPQNYGVSGYILFLQISLSSNSQLLHIITLIVNSYFIIEFYNYKFESAKLPRPPSMSDAHQKLAQVWMTTFCLGFYEVKNFSMAAYIHPHSQGPVHDFYFPHMC